MSKPLLLLQRVSYAARPGLFCVESYAIETGGLYWRAWSDVSQESADDQARKMIVYDSGGRSGLWVSDEVEEREATRLP